MTEKKRPNGRPPKYKPEYCKGIIKYFKEFEGFPTIAGICVEFGVTKQTIHNWCEEYPDFLDAYTRAKHIQEQNLVSGAMTGKYNPQFSAFFSKNNLGYKDKKETDMNVGGQKDNPVEVTITFVEPK